MAIVATETGGLVACKAGLYRRPDGAEAIKALSWKEVRTIVDRFATLNPYDRALVPGSILNIVEEINFDSTGKRRQVHGYGISAKRYALFTFEGENVRIIKASEHGLGLYYRPKEGRDPECDVPAWIKEGWQWILSGALGLPGKKPDWFSLPVMRRIAISTPNVMAALRKLNRDQARPYNFALSPVLVNLSGSTVTLLGQFEKDSSQWSKACYINIHDGNVHTLNPPTLLALPQTFDMVFHQYLAHPEAKSLAPDGSPCKGNSDGFLRRYPVKASEFHVIGKETERGWEQAEDVSTLLPSLIRYGNSGSNTETQLLEKIRNTPLSMLEAATGLSRHTLVRARRGERVHAISLQCLRNAAATVPVREP